MNWLEEMAKEEERRKVWARVRIAVMTVAARKIYLTLRKGMGAAQAVVEDKTIMKWMKRVVSVESAVDFFERD